MIDYTYEYFEAPTIPEQKIWFLVELFLSAKAYYFENIHRNYESQVIQLSQLMEKDRRELRLNPEELSVLINFLDLKTLRDNILAPLRNISHEIFRNSKTFEPFDTYVSELFHEMSILKDVYLQLSQISQTFQQFDPEEIQAIVDDVHDQFPQKTRHIYHIFNKAFLRLQKILPDYRDNIFLLRCAFFEEKELFQKGILSLDEFYRILFDGEAAWGYYYVAKSFYDSLFYSQAQASCTIALQKLKESPSPKKSKKENQKEKEDSLLKLLKALQNKLKNKTSVIKAQRA